MTDQFPDPDGLNGEDLPTCPECGALLDDDDGNATLPASVDDETVRVGIDCIGCGAALVLVVESALPDALGMDLTVDRRRE